MREEPGRVQAADLCWENNALREVSCTNDNPHFLVRYPEETGRTFADGKKKLGSEPPAHHLWDRQLRLDVNVGISCSQCDPLVLVIGHSETTRLRSGI